MQLNLFADLLSLCKTYMFSAHFWLHLWIPLECVIHQCTNISVLEEINTVHQEHFHNYTESTQ